MPRPVDRSLPIAWVPVLGGLSWSVPFAVLTHGTARVVALSAIWALVAWVQLAALALWAGGNLLFGRAESSTEDVLRHRRRMGWRVAQDVALEDGRDIDHVAIGPGGVVVVETKCRRDVRADAITWAAHRALRSGRTIARALPSVDGAPVIPVVVVWGPETSAGLPAAVDGVRVVHGPDLGTWLDALGTEALTGAQVQAAWQQLCESATVNDLGRRDARRVAARRHRRATLVRAHDFTRAA